MEGGRRSRARVNYSAVLKRNAGEGSEDEDQASHALDVLSHPY